MSILTKPPQSPEELINNLRKVIEIDREIIGLHEKTLKIWETEVTNRDILIATQAELIKVLKAEVAFNQTARAIENYDFFSTRNFRGPIF
jgi:hypothetical protein